jgi:RNA polymerase sigma factor (TIGR02999 family)
MAEITELLRSARTGDAEALSRVFDLVYADLKRMAHNRLSGNAGLRELDTGSLVHESFLRLSKRAPLDVSERAAFMGYMGRVMRSVVIDHVRAQVAQKRGGAAAAVTLTTGVQGERLDGEQLLAMNAALDVLGRIAPEYHRLIELRYFAGLSVSEVAELMGTSTRTVTREWDKAHAFLRKLVQEGATPLP